ncbi:unnamed protein product [Penicillium nalgiovense]|nr:unnamed protein product [Penicillium nalgiovense]
MIIDIPLDHSLHHFDSSLRFITSIHHFSPSLLHHFDSSLPSITITDRYFDPLRTILLTSSCRQQIVTSSFWP